MDDYLRDFNKPHAIGNAAPYGSREEFYKMERIRYRVIEMMRNLPSVCSLAKPSVLPLGVLMYLSPVIEPQGDIPEEEIRQHIQESFRELLERTTK
jgi:hypothetical protein